MACASASPPLTLSAPTWARMPSTPSTRRSMVTTGMPACTACSTAGASALTSSGEMTMALTFCTIAASMSAVCLGAEFWPSLSTRVTPSASASTLIWLSMCTKNGKLRLGTEPRTTSLSWAKAIGAATTSAPTATDEIRNSRLFIWLSSSLVAGLPRCQHPPGQRRNADRSQCQTFAQGDGPLCTGCGSGPMPVGPAPALRLAAGAGAALAATLPYRHSRLR